MIEELKNIKSEKKDLRNFGITIGLILLVIAGYLFFKEKESFQMFITIGFTLLFISFIIPVVFKPVFLIWMSFATILGWFMTHVILSLLYYTIITPIGVISRLFGKQFLELKWDQSKESYWNKRLVEGNNNDYKKQF